MCCINQMKKSIPNLNNAMFSDSIHLRLLSFGDLNFLQLFLLDEVHDCHPKHNDLLHQIFCT